jgi:hypothetical protein
MFSLCSSLSIGYKNLESSAHDHRYARFRQAPRGAGIDRKAAEAHAEAMARHVFPQLATKADLDKAVSDLTIRLVLTMIGVAGLALAVAKAL